MTRCTDRFVKYPYPKTLYSNYKEHYYKKLAGTRVQNHKSAFNLEKETKIINPHKMDLKTTHGISYRGDKGLPKDPKKQVVKEENKPIVQMSSYMAAFPNWDNGRSDVFHEKHPQFPYYSLPFRGDSTYKSAHTESQQRELRRQQELLAKANRDAIKL